MTSSVHHIIADIAARLHDIEVSLLDACAAHQVQQFSLQTARKFRNTSAKENDHYNNTTDDCTTSALSTVDDLCNTAPRLNLSMRLAACKTNFQSSYGAMPVSDICQKLDYINATLHPLLSSHNTGAGEPEIIIDTPIAEAHYAVIKRHLTAGFRNENSENCGMEPSGTSSIIRPLSSVSSTPTCEGTVGVNRFPSSANTVTGVEEITEMKYNIEALLNSNLIGVHNGLSPTLVDILAYDGNDTARNSSEMFSGSELKNAYNLAVENAKRTHELRLRITKLKGCYSTLVDYVNKKMCVWDMEIDELEQMTAEKNRRAAMTI